MKIAIFAFAYAVMLPRVPMINAGNVWLQYLADVSANGRIMLAMKTHIRPRRIDHWGLTIVAKDEEIVAMASLNIPVGRKCTAVMTLQW